CAVEIRLQVDQVDRAVQLHGSAAEKLLGSAAGLGVRFLGQCQSTGAASALEPGDRGTDRAARTPADPAVQRLRRPRRPPLQGARARAALGVAHRRLQRLDTSPGEVREMAYVLT